MYVAVALKKVFQVTPDNLLDYDVCHTINRYKCFKKQSHIDTCIQAFMELESLGFNVLVNLVLTW